MSTRARLIGASTVTACAACGVLIDLNDLPPRADAGAGGEVGTVAAGPSCPPDGAVTFCERECARPPLSAPIFCADFENDAGLSQWPNFKAFDNPILFRDADIDVGVAPNFSGLSNRAAFVRAATPEGGVSAAVLLHGLDGRHYRGLHIAAHLQFAAINFLDAGDDNQHLRAVSSFGFGNSNIAVGIGLGFISAGDDLHIRPILLRESFFDFAAINIGSVFLDPNEQSTKSDFSRNWAPFELLVGPPKVLREAGAECKPQDSDDENFTHAQVRFAQLSTHVACRRLPKELEATDWYDDAAFYVGSGISGYGNVEVFVDQIVVRGIP